MKIPNPVLISAFAALLLVGCDKAKEFAREAGLVSRPAPAAEEIIILCDSGKNSTCTESHLAATLDVVLPYAAARPGSTVALWSVGERPTDSRQVAERVVTKPKRNGVRAAQAHEKRFVTDARTFFVTAAAPLFRETRRKETPLFETITAASLQPPSMHRRIVLLSDLREQTPRTATTECAPLPDEAQLIERLQERGVLAPELLRNTTMHLSFVTYAPVEGERCPFDVGHFAKLQHLWQAVLHASGATVQINTGAPQLQE